MIRHVVAWKLKEIAEGKTKEENAKIIKQGLEGLKPIVKEIISIEVGINFNNSDAAFDLVLITDFSSIEDLNAYQTNPNHLKIAGYIGKVREDRIVADYNI